MKTYPVLSEDYPHNDLLCNKDGMNSSTSTKKTVADIHQMSCFQICVGIQEQHSCAYEFIFPFCVSHITTECITELQHSSQNRNSRCLSSIYWHKGQYYRKNIQANVLLVYKRHSKQSLHRVGPAVSSNSKAEGSSFAQNPFFTRVGHMVRY